MRSWGTHSGDAWTMFSREGLKGEKPTFALTENKLLFGKKKLKVFLLYWEMCFIQCEKKIFFE